MTEDRSTTGQLRSMWEGLPGVAKVGGLVVIVGLIIWLALSAVTEMTKRWEPLASGLTGAEQARVLEYLRGNNVPYRIDAGAIMVPAERAPELKIEMAGEDLQVGQLKGLERLESIGLGDTETTIDAKLTKALQEEIQMALNGLPIIQNSQVSLALPPDRGFLTSPKEPASASVWLTLSPGVRLATAQVRGLQVQIANAVQNLSPDDVSILDQNSNQLSHKLDGDAQLIEARDREEEKIRSSVLDLLEPKVGRNRVRVRAAVELDRTSKKETVKDVDPARGAEVRSVLTEEESSNTPGAAGEPGSRANTGEGFTQSQAGAGSRSSKTREERETQYATSLTETATQPGQVLRKSVSVLIDYNREEVEAEGGGTDVQYVPWGDDTIRSLEQSLRDAVGVDADRGDSLTLTQQSFDEQHRIEQQIQREEVREQIRRYWDPLDWSDWTTVYKIPLILFGIFFVVWFVLRPVGKRAISYWTKLPSEAPAQLPDALPKTVEELEAEIEGRLEEELEIPTREVKKGTILKKRLTELARNEPENFAQLIRTWLYE